MPEPLRGRSFVAIEAAILGDDSILAPLRALAPEIDMVGPIPPAALIEIHNDPKHPMPGIADHRVLADAPPEAIAALVQAAGPELVAVELRHLGGNLPVDGFSLFAIGVPMDAESAMAIDAALARVMEATAPYDSGRSLLNFSDRPAPAERLWNDLDARRAVKAAGGWRRRVRRQPPAGNYGVVVDSVNVSVFA